MQLQHIIFLGFETQTAGTTLTERTSLCLNSLLAQTPIHNKHNCKGTTFLIEKFTYFYYESDSNNN